MPAPTRKPASVPTCGAVVGVIPWEINPLCRGRSRCKAQHVAKLRCWWHSNRQHVLAMYAG